MAAKSNRIQPKTRMKGTSSVSKARVLLVDDHPVVREGLAHVIDAEPDLMVCGQAADAPEALQAIERLKPDVAVVDISLGASHGIELLKDIKVRQPRLPVLVLSMHDESLYGERALRAGAKGYILKEEPPRKLLEALRRVLRGDIYLSEPMTRKLLHKISGESAESKGVTPVERLSDRELEVFELVGRGHRPRSIAAKLHLSVKTVEYHCGNIKRKLNLSDAAALLQHAIQWIQSESTR